GCAAGHDPRRRGRGAMIGRPDSLRVAVGGLVCVVAVLALRPGWPASMLVLAALVIVPLGLPLAAPSLPSDPRAGLRRVADRFRLPAALALSASFALPPGGPAAVLAVPWMAVTAFDGIDGLARFIRGSRTASEACP